MVDRLVRPIKERLFAPLALRVGRLVHPSLISLASFPLGIAAFWCVLKGMYGVGVVFWLLNRVLDGLDGTVARVTGRQSDLGGYLDIILDFLVYSLLPIAFVIRATRIAAYSGNQGDHLVWALVGLMAVFYVNSAGWMYISALLEKAKQGAALKQETTSVTMPTGIVEGTETLVFYTLFFVFPHLLVYLILAMAILTFLGIIQRAVWAFRHLSR